MIFFYIIMIHWILLYIYVNILFCFYFILFYFIRFHIFSLSFVTLLFLYYIQQVYTDIHLIYIQTNTHVFVQSIMHVYLTMWYHNIIIHIFIYMTIYVVIIITGITGEVLAIVAALPYVKKHHIFSVGNTHHRTSPTNQANHCAAPENQWRLVRK